MSEDHDIVTVTGNFTCVVIFHKPQLPFWAMWHRNNCIRLQSSPV